MNIPSELKYTATHEWVKDCGGVFEVGLSDYAQKELGDIVFVDITAQVGDTVTAGEPFANIESVKSVSDINSPVTGIVKEINRTVLDNAAAINEDCYTAYLVKVEGVLGDGVMSHDDYVKTPDVAKAIAEGK
jgi:glycine cleavage system H protein